MKIYNKNELKMKPLNERINGFTVAKHQIQLKEDAGETEFVSDINSIDDAKKDGDNAITNANSINNSDNDSTGTFIAQGKTTHDQIKNTQSFMQQNPGINKDNINVVFPNQTSANGGKINIHSHRMPRPTLESVNRLRNNSVSYTKGELNKIILNN